MQNRVESNEASANNSTAAITVGNVNAVDILVIQQDEEKRVPIRPICEALGVDFSGQLQKLKSDPIFGPTVETVSTVGADNKRREMQTIPHRFIFGWIFRIDSRNVKEESREALIRYQLECNNALYEHFEMRTQYIEERQEKIEEHRDIIQLLSETLMINKEQLKNARAALSKVREKDFDAWLEDKRQLAIDFTEKEVQDEN